MLRRYTKVARDINAPMPERLAAMLADGRDREGDAAQPRPDVACHNDLLSENFIIDANGKMWIIDWEYGGMTDPYFDLGDHVMEHPFSREEERLVIETYCGQMDERLFGRMMLYKIVSAIWWDVWAMIQHTVSKIDFDYMEWAMERVGAPSAACTTPTTRGGSRHSEKSTVYAAKGVRREGRVFFATDVHGSRSAGVSSSTRRRTMRRTSSSSAAT